MRTPLSAFLNPVSPPPRPPPRAQNDHETCTALWPYGCVQPEAVGSDPSHEGWVDGTCLVHHTPGETGAPMWREEGILPGTGSNLVKIELPEGEVPPNNIHVHAALAYYSATLGAAKATLLEDKLGNFEEGKEADFVVLNPYGSFDTARRVRLMGRRECNPLKQMWEVLFMLMIMGSAENIASTYVMGHEAYQNKEKPLDMAEELCTFMGNTGREPFPRPFTNDYDYYADPGCVNAFAKCVSCLAECTEPHPWGRTLPCGCKAPTYHGNNPDCPELTDYETKNPCKKRWNGNTCTPRPDCPPPAPPPPAPKQP